MDNDEVYPLIGILLVLSIKKGFMRKQMDRNALIINVIKEFLYTSNRIQAHLMHAFRFFSYFRNITKKTKNENNIYILYIICWMAA